MLYVPEGCAHGYLTLEPNTTVEYLMSAFYQPDAASGVRWDDPLFGVSWPMQPTVMSTRDRSWPDFKPFAEQVPSS
jgi:dTDP-4-dehydrorhamnose 3,5-epimerase